MELGVYCWGLGTKRSGWWRWQPSIQWLVGIQCAEGRFSGIGSGASAKLVAFEFEVETAASKTEFASGA